VRAQGRRDATTCTGRGYQRPRCPPARPFPPELAADLQGPTIWS
jgi:hypothetical protein